MKNDRRGLTERDDDFVVVLLLETVGFLGDSLDGEVFVVGEIDKSRMRLGWCRSWSWLGFGLWFGLDNDAFGWWRWSQRLDDGAVGVRRGNGWRYGFTEFLDSGVRIVEG